MPDPRKTSVAAPVGSDESGAFPEQDALFNNLVARGITVAASSPYNAFAIPGEIVSAVNPYNLRAYGSKGDGVTNDTTAVDSWVAAMNAAGAAEGTVPPGTHLVTPGTVRNLTGNPYLHGAGVNASIIKARAAAGNYCLQASAVTSLKITDLTMDGTGLTGPISGFLSILGPSTDIRIRDVRVQNVPAGNGISITNVNRMWVEDSYFLTCTNSGFFANDPGVGNFNDHIWVLNNRFTNCGAVTLGNAALQFGGGQSSVRTFHRFTHLIGNHVTGAGNVGIAFDSNDWSFTDSNYVDNTGALGECISHSGSNCKIRFNHCISGSGAACILKWGVSGRTASNDHDDIAHNTCTGSTGQQIGIATNANGCTINSLDIHDNECYGVATSVGIQSFNSGGITTGTWTQVLVRNNKLMGFNLATSWVAYLGPPTVESGNVVTAAGFTPVNTMGGPVVSGTLMQAISSQTLVASGAAAAFQAAFFSYFIVNLSTFNCTSSTITGLQVGQEVIIEFVQDSVGGRTYAWPATCKFVGGAAPATTVAFTAIMVKFWWDGFSLREIARSVTT